MELQKGTKIHGYALVDFISRGATAEVWRIRDESGIDKALKIFSPGLRMDDATLDLLIDEFKLLYKLDHPHVLRSEIMGAYQKVPYIIMPYYGDNLAFDMNARARRQPTGSKGGLYSEEECVQLMRQMGSGLSYLHEQKIIHQDLKPENILFDPDTNPRHYVLTDFGISTRIKENLARLTMPRPAAYALTPAYAAPEQFSGRPVYKSDVFSLGAVLFEMAEGRLPFSRQGFVKDPMAQGLRPHFERRDLSGLFQEMVLSALDERPENRPDPEDFVSFDSSRRREESRTVFQPVTSRKDDTSDAGLSTGQFHSAPASFNPVRSRPRENWWIWAFLASIGVMVGLFLIFYLIGKGNLREADRLFSEGRIEEAAALYVGLPLAMGIDGASQGKLKTDRVLRKYEEILRFRHGRAPVKRNGKWGFIGLDGQEVIMCQFVRVTEFNGNTAAACLTNQECGILDLKGEWKLPPEYEGFQAMGNDAWVMIKYHDGTRIEERKQF